MHVSSLASLSFTSLVGYGCDVRRQSISRAAEHIDVDPRLRLPEHNQLRWVGVALALRNLCPRTAKDDARRRLRHQLLLVLPHRRFARRQRRWWPCRPCQRGVGEAAPTFRRRSRASRASRPETDRSMMTSVSGEVEGKASARSKLSEPSAYVPQVGSWIGPSKVVARGEGGKSEQEGCRFKSF